MNYKVHSPSANMRLSIATVCLSGFGPWWQQLSRVLQMFPSSAFQFLLGDSVVFPGQMRCIIQPVLGLPRGLLPVGRAQKTSKGRSPGGILIRCPNHLNWPLLAQRSSCSTLSSLRMSERLILSLRLSPANLTKWTFDLLHLIWPIIQIVSLLELWNIIKSIFAHYIIVVTRSWSFF